MMSECKARLSQALDMRARSSGKVMARVSDWGAPASSIQVMVTVVDQRSTRTFVPLVSGLKLMFTLRGIITFLLVFLNLTQSSRLS